MEKILLLIDEQGVDTSEVKFGGYLSNLSKSTVTGLFIHPEKSNDVDETTILNASNGSNLLVERSVGSVIDHKRAFAEACSIYNIRAEQNTIEVANLDELFEETRFADVLLVSHRIIHQMHEGGRGELLLRIMSKAECPVIIAPQEFTGIDEILFAYDGTQSAVYAIKQFTYLFPEFSEHKVVFMQVKEKAGSEITDAAKIGDYLKTHYTTSIGFHTLYGNAYDQLFNYFIGKKNIFVVMGAFGRNRISLSLKRSASEPVMKSAYIPLFVTHY